MADIKATMGLDGSGVKSELGGLMGTVQSFGNKLAGAFAIGAVISFARGALAATTALKDMAENTGLTFREVQLLRNAAINAGADFDKTATGVQKLVMELGRAKGGSDDAIKLFAKVGITLQDLAGMETPDAIAAVGKAMEAAKPGTQAYSDILALIGTKSGPEAAKAMREYAEALQDAQKAAASGTIISDEDMAKVEIFNRWMSKLKVGAQTAIVELLATGGKKTMTREQILALQNLGQAAGIGATPQGVMGRQNIGGVTTTEPGRIIPESERKAIADAQIANAKPYEAARNQATNAETEGRKRLEKEALDEHNKTQESIDRAMQEGVAAANKAAEDEWKRQKKIRNVEAQAADDIAGLAKSVAVSPMAVDQLARIGGQIGGASNPALTVAMRHLKIAEETKAINAQMQKDIAKLDLGLGA